MTLTFYPNRDDAHKGELNERITVLMDAAERYKAIIMDAAHRAIEGGTEPEVKVSRPRDIDASYNWEEIALVLAEVRELLEGTTPEKAKKEKLLMRLAEVYEVLRAAKMAKLEAVRLALVNEAKHLQGGSGTG